MKGTHVHKSPIQVISAFQKQAEDYTVLTNKIAAWVKEWIDTLGLGYWNIAAEYVPAICVELPSAAAMCKSSFEYQWGEIKFYLVQLNGETDSCIENTVVHELLHMLVRPMRTKNSRIEHEEWVVTNLARSFITAKYKNSLKEPCKKAA